MLNREEYIEQAYFFEVIAKRLPENIPMQEILEQLRAETLATTKLPMAIDYMLAELKHSGTMHPAMQQLGHYFSPFQTYLMSEAESDRGRFDIRVAIEILQREADYRGKTPSRQGLFMYEFEGGRSSSGILHISKTYNPNTFSVIFPWYPFTNTCLKILGLKLFVKNLDYFIKLNFEGFVSQIIDTTRLLSQKFKK